MSLSSTTDRVAYSGNSVTTGFSFPYKFFSNSDLVVLVKVNSTGVETTQIITTNYTVTGAGVEAGGTVNFLTAPVSGSTVIIYRDKSAIQELDVTENGKIPSENLEKQLDKLTMMVQRVKNKLARTIGLKEGFTATFDPSLPALMVNDGYLKTTSAGTALEYVAEADLINTISTGSQAFTASRALVSDSNGLATQSATTSTEIGYVSGVTSALQTQLNAKQDTITGAASTVVSSNLTANRAVISGAAGKLATTTVTHTELDYLSGVTSAIQTQLNSKASSTFTAPTVQRFTSGSGTYTKPANVLYIQVEMVGGGGGGGGSGTAGAGNGGDGGSTTFGTSLLTATGGIKGSSGAINVGGSATVNSPALRLVSVSGAQGGGSITSAASLAGGAGAGTPFAGPAFASSNTGVGYSAVTNSGGGGGGAYSQQALYGGGEGGGAGGYLKAIINSPSSTYSYAVGAAGTAGAAGTSGYAGGAGAAGIVVVTEFYQ